MRYKLLGKSGLRVSELCLGTMTFGEGEGWTATKAESKKMFYAFANAGGNFIDTANVYTRGTSEKHIGDFIYGDRGHFIVATKYTITTREGDPVASGNSRKNLVQSLDASLKRLKTEYIDLYWIHAWDYMTPVEEVMRALDDAVRQGKILYVGASDTPAWIVSHANTLAQLQGWTPFVGIQIEYNLTERTPERDLLPMARAFDLAVLAWSPLAAGVLTGKFLPDRKTNQPTRVKEGSPRLAERNLKIAEEVVTVGKDLGCSPAQVALSWVRQQYGVIIPILGARSESQLKENLACLDITLSEEQLKKLNEISAIEGGFPHEFLKRDSIRKIIYSGLYGSIDNHRKIL